MSKSHSSRSKNQPQLSQHFSPQEKATSKTAPIATAAANAEPLTLQILVGELEKLHKSVTTELTSSLNASLAPIQASLQTMTETVAAHTVTISAMETALTEHSDGISSLEDDVATLKSKLETSMKMNDKLQLAVEDLISRSKRKNLRVVGIPEGTEGSDTRLFMTRFLLEVTGDALQEQNLELERAHRSLAPKPSQGSRPFIIRFHKYTTKELVLQWAKKNRNISYQGHPVRIFEDFSATLAKKRASFNKVKSQLYKDGIRFGLLYPARLRVTVNGLTRIFDTAEEAEHFYQEQCSK